jgi:hypothetical protein
MTERKKDKKISMEEVISFLPPIQVGYEIYYENLEIEGIQNRQTTVWQFIQGSNHLLDWAQEPSNPQNPHAIKLFGISDQIFSTKQELLGYVPENVAKQIVSSGLWPFLQLRLDCIYVAKQGFLAIRFQILGPIRKKTEAEKPDKSIIEREKKYSRISAPGPHTDKKIDKLTKYLTPIKRMFFFMVRFIILTMGMGFAFIGGKMGTAAWQAGETFFSITMLFPMTLVISGGILIWIGIKPSKPTYIDPGQPTEKL